MTVLAPAYGPDMAAFQHRQQTLDRRLHQRVVTDKPDELFGVQLSGERPEPGSDPTGEQDCIYVGLTACHFDCNLFIYYVPERRLYSFTRKINFIRFFLENEGDVLAIRQPRDEDVTCYGVKGSGGKVFLLISNKDRQRDKRTLLQIAGFDHRLRAERSVMDVNNEDFEPAGKLAFQGGRVVLPLPKLSITRVDLTPERCASSFSKQTAASMVKAHSGIGRENK